MFCLESIVAINQTAANLARQGHPERHALELTGVDLGTEKAKSLPVLSAPIHCPLCGQDVEDCTHDESEWADFRQRQVG